MTPKMQTFTVRNKEVSISSQAADLLKHLCELEDAGLIQKSETVLAGDGYDEGSTEVEIPATVTFKGRQVYAEMRKP